ncbi:multicopper oxidase domain-containing protein [Streptomyces sp. MUM 203J]|nr:multicopper oxidase domain-containing protein [Streptomyces sp. MUM 203J]
MFVAEFRDDVPPVGGVTQDGGGHSTASGAGEHARVGIGPCAQDALRDERADRLDVRTTPHSATPVRSGERVRLSFVNSTTMWHLMHLHGHTYALADGGARKDTSIVLPGKKLDVDLDTDNPGLWMIHCHNVYHAGSGMMTVLGYLK